MKEKLKTKGLSLTFAIDFFCGYTSYVVWVGVLPRQELSHLEDKVTEMKMLQRMCECTRRDRI